jgi:pimeloyl-ACP methyl ester carboxylesterase
MRTEFQLSAGSIAALLAEPENPHATVLFVPGYTGSKEDFLPLLAPLAESGYRAIAIDQRGQHESSWADDEDDYLIESLGAEVSELAVALREATGILHLVGHSFGGLVTRAAVIAKPELFDTFTLMGSGPSVLGGERGQIVDAMIWILTEHGMDALIEQAEQRTLSDENFRRQTPARQQVVLERFRANDPTGLRIMGTELRRVGDRTAELVETAVPKLVLHGVDDDAWTPDVQQDMANRLRAAHAVISGAAHSPALENPESTLAALLKFWE